MTEAAARRPPRRPRGARALAAVTALAALAGAALAGCRNSDRAGELGTAGPAFAIDVAAVNALVPAALAGRLVFERRQIAVDRGGHQATYTLAAPAGWAQTSKLFAHLRPAGAPPHGPRLDIGDNCDGPCTPKPWGPIADRVHFAPLAGGKVIKDERAAGRRTMIAELGAGASATTHVVVAWWNDADRSYHACTAVLDAALAAAAPAFDRACQAVAITGED